MAVHLTRDMPTPWRKAEHLRQLSLKLVGVAAGRTRRLLVAMPPRHGKSQLVSVWFPLWYLNLFPHKRIVIASYGADLAEDFGRLVRDLAEEHAASLRLRVKGDTRAAKRWKTTEGGEMYSVGVGGPLTGRGADVLIIDDPFKDAEEALSPNQRRKVWDWYESTAYTRLMPGGAVIVMATRWHREDLTGRLLSEEHRGDKWEKFFLPAIAEHGDPLGRKEGEALWPDQFSIEDLLGKKAVQTPYWWSCLYQQKPTKAEGAEFPSEWLEGADLFFDRWPESRMKVMGVDPSKGAESKSGDYSAIVSMAVGLDGLLYIDADLKRRPTNEIVADTIAIAKQFRPEAVAFEANQFQELLSDQLVQQSGAMGIPLPVWNVVNHVKKEIRIRRLTPYLARRQCRFKRDSPGVALLLEQLREFPLGEHDDGPDALEFCLRTAIHIETGADGDGLGEELPLDV